MPYIASRFALLAMLLLVLAPVISQQIMWSPKTDAGHHGGQTAHAPMAMAGMVTMAGMNGDGHHSPDRQGSLPEACGYCELLIHVPLIFWVFIPLCWLLTTLTGPRPPSPVVAPVIRLFPVRPPPRGPPGLSA